MAEATENDMIQILRESGIEDVEIDELNEYELQNLKEMAKTVRDEDILQVLSALGIEPIMVPDPPEEGQQPEYWIDAGHLLLVLDYRASHEYSIEHSYNRAVLGKISVAIDPDDFVNGTSKPLMKERKLRISVAIDPDDFVNETSKPRIKHYLLKRLMVGAIRKYVRSNKVSHYNARDAFMIHLEPERAYSIRESYAEKKQQEQQNLQ